MKKRIFAVLLTVCLLVGLLPITALADGVYIERGDSFSYVVPSSYVVSEGMFVYTTGTYSFTIFPDFSGNGSPALYYLNSSYSYTKCDGTWDGNTYTVTMEPGRAYYWGHSGASSRAKYTVVFNGTGEPASQDDLILVGVPGGNLYFNPVSGAITSADVTVTEAEIPKEIDGTPVTAIGSKAFEYCDSLTSVTMPDSVTSIGDEAFSRCTALTSVAIPSGVTSLGKGVFFLCSGLTQVTLPEGLTSIGYQAFADCTALTGVTFPASLTSLGNNAFSFCTGLTSLTIPASVQSVGREAFSSCTGLTSLTISDGVQSIEPSAFNGCSALTEVTIPKSVTEIGNSAFGDCSKLTAFYVDPDNPSYASQDGVLFNKDMTELIQCPMTKSGDYTVPAGVTSIEWAAFSECANLTGVTLPDGLTSIGASAFEYCRSLTEIEIPDGVTILPYCAFSGCDTFSKITIPASVTLIGQSAVPGYRNLTVYYGGSQSRWDKITIHSNSGLGENATIHFASTEQEDLCKVEFSTGIAPVILTRGECVDRPADPIPYSAKYEFGGWYTDNAYQTAYDFSAAVTEDITLYAKWIDLCEVDGHIFDEGVVTKPATCTTAGEKTYTCTREGCGYTKYETLRALHHDWDEGVVTIPATCTEPGERTYTCTREGCGETWTEKIPATGHKLNENGVCIYCGAENPPALETLYVDGVDMANGGTVEGAAYDGTTKTLTLTNAHITGYYSTTETLDGEETTIRAGIYYKGEETLHIALENDSLNTITLHPSRSGEAEFGSYIPAFGIYANGNVQITSETYGNLYFYEGTITGADAVFETKEQVAYVKAQAIYTTDSLTIDENAYVDTRTLSGGFNFDSPVKLYDWTYDYAVNAAAVQVYTGGNMWIGQGRDWPQIFFGSAQAIGPMIMNSGTAKIGKLYGGYVAVNANMRSLTGSTAEVEQMTVNGGTVSIQSLTAERYVVLSGGNLTTNQLTAANLRVSDGTLTAAASSTKLKGMIQLSGYADISGGTVTAEGGIRSAYETGSYTLTNGSFYLSGDGEVTAHGDGIYFGGMVSVTENASLTVTDVTSTAITGWQGVTIADNAVVTAVGPFAGIQVGSYNSTGKFRMTGGTLTAAADSADDDSCNMALYVMSGSVEFSGGHAELTSSPGCGICFAYADEAECGDFSVTGGCLKVSGVKGGIIWKGSNGLPEVTRTVTVKTDPAELRYLAGTGSDGSYTMYAATYVDSDVAELKLEPDCNGWPANGLTTITFGKEWVSLVSLDAGSITLLFDENEAADVIAAVYDADGKMLSFGSTAVKQNAGEVQVGMTSFDKADAAVVKVFFFNNFQEMTPLCREVTASVRVP